MIAALPDAKQHPDRNIRCCDYFHPLENTKGVALFIRSCLMSQVSIHDIEHATLRLREIPLHISRYDHAAYFYLLKTNKTGHYLQQDSLLHGMEGYQADPV